MLPSRTYAREWIRTGMHVCVNIYIVNTQEILYSMPRSHETEVIVGRFRKMLLLPAYARGRYAREWIRT